MSVIGFLSDERVHIAGGVAIIFGIVLLIGYKTDKKEQELIASGKCIAVAEQLYQPPPTMVCTSYNQNGACMAFTPLVSAPYLRTFWQCEGGEEFWRRSRKWVQ